jgi:hypothetical protein
VPEQLSLEEHQKRHVLLHGAFDELVADFLEHHREKMPSTTTVMELMQWSHRQTQEPTERR